MSAVRSYGKAGISEVVVRRKRTWSDRAAWWGAQPQLNVHPRVCKQIQRYTRVSTLSIGIGTFLHAALRELQRSARREGGRERERECVCICIFHGGRNLLQLASIFIAWSNMEMMGMPVAEHRSCTWCHRLYL